MQRQAGVLLHPTSLPNEQGIGTVGPEAERFLECMSAADFRLWQILPLCPTGYADSPYAGLSALGLNPMLVDLQSLAAEGLLRGEDIDSVPSADPSAVDFSSLPRWKSGVLRQAFGQFMCASGAQTQLDEFQAANAGWLPDFALFMALKDAHGGVSWSDWELPLRRRRPDALARVAREHRDDIAFHVFLQLVLERQWSAVKARAEQLGIAIVGDMPIFVAYDSADVWANQDLFRLDAAGDPEVVTGVPPDYFSATGQLWGNPHYRWEAMREDGFRWWIERFRRLTDLVDIIRLDHFRGFAAAWTVPFGNPTAEHGRWEPYPGGELLTAVEAALGRLPIIAEDLGVITADVVELRRQFEFPGMRILQFAFDDGPEDAGLPHNFERNTVVYTGTHDNDTTRGWLESISSDTRARIRDYLDSPHDPQAWDMIRLALASVADTAVIPLQDLLNRGREARMNHPGTTQGNWRWRFRWEDLEPEILEHAHRLNVSFGRAEGAERA